MKSVDIFEFYLVILRFDFCSLIFLPILSVVLIASKMFSL